MWYNKIANNIDLLPDFLDYYYKELEQAKKECNIHGVVETNIKQLPGVTEHRFNQLQEIEAVLNFMNLQLKSIKKKHFQKYLEKYARALSSRDAEKYTDGEKEVVDYEVLINEVALLRNNYLGIMKALESKNFMMGHIVRLRVAGMEDIVV